VDVTGSLVFNLYIKDLTAANPGRTDPRTAWSVAWASDSQNLFYAVFDDSHRPFKFFRHMLGANPAETPWSVTKKTIPSTCTASARAAGSIFS
jgi:oligopeptidase B